MIMTIKKFFTTTAGTPVKSCTLTLNKFPENQNMATKQFSNVNIWKKYFKLLFSAMKFASRVFTSAILFTALANFIPELREQMPSFYCIVDFLVVCFEWMCTQLINIF